MEELTGVSKRTHKLILNSRRSCNLTGVNDVLLETEQGMLMIKGNELHVNRLMLDKGEVDVDGRVDSFTYSEQSNMGGKGESLLARLFK